jgi:hemerythrin-like domain-containing protein
VSRNGLPRDPALVPLSRDHHDALVKVLELRRSPGSPEVARRFVRFAASDLEGHMGDEEEVVLPAVASTDPHGAARIRREHGELRALARGLAADLEAGGDPSKGMDAVARLLHDHVRYEEREFFMRVQSDLSTEALARMGAEIEARRAARGVASACAVPAR